MDFSLQPRLNHAWQCLLTSWHFIVPYVHERLHALASTLKTYHARRGFHTTAADNHFDVGLDKQSCEAADGKKQKISMDSFHDTGTIALICAWDLGDWIERRLNRGVNAPGATAKKDSGWMWNRRSNPSEMSGQITSRNSLSVPLTLSAFVSYLTQIISTVL
ncbi:hypothetical protein M405DRAFT_858573 [Rhizopogon salebrosus TDB-379]|nr:hypothetical protein M405DRAFT_858573 [Rhizopogon salebrosus TDB-379]